MRKYIILSIHIVFCETRIVIYKNTYSLNKETNYAILKQTKKKQKSFVS